MVTHALTDEERRLFQPIPVPEWLKTRRAARDFIDDERDKMVEEYKAHNKGRNLDIGQNWAHYEMLPALRAWARKTCRQGYATVYRGLTPPKDSERGGGPRAKFRIYVDNLGIYWSVRHSDIATWSPDELDPDADDMDVPGRAHVVDTRRFDRGVYGCEAVLKGRVAAGSIDWRHTTLNRATWPVEREVTLKAGAPVELLSVSGERLDEPVWGNTGKMMPGQRWRP